MKKIIIHSFLPKYEDAVYYAYRCLNTSNYGLKELRDEKGLQPRICDRIARMVSWANVKIEAPNYRREQVKKQEPIF